jgi:precorrin-6A/cobalt-precorrin-6A reductase
VTRILILGGTREAVELARALHERGDLRVISSLAGRTQTPNLPPGELRIGGFGGAAGLRDYLARQRIDLLIDATHPFAEQMRANAARAAREGAVPLLRLERVAWQRQPGDNWIFADSAADAARAAPAHGTRAFLTTGVKDVAAFADIESVWFLVRLVDTPDGLLPLRRYDLVTGRGPFAAAAEEALMRRHRIDLLIGKESGGESTYGKIAAARALGLPVILIRRPPRPTGVETVVSVESAARWVERLTRPP